MARTSAPTRSIAVGFDGSASGAAALRWAFAEADRRGTDLLVLTVQPVGDLAAHLDRRRALRARVRAVAADHPAVRFTHLVFVGPVASALVGHSRDADSLVLGGHRRPWLVDRLLGTVSARCARHATCKVRLVREG